MSAMVSLYHAHVSLFLNLYILFQHYLIDVLLLTFLFKLRAVAHFDNHNIHLKHTVLFRKEFCMYKISTTFIMLIMHMTIMCKFIHGRRTKQIIYFTPLCRSKSRAGINDLYYNYHFIMRCLTSICIMCTQYILD